MFSILSCNGGILTCFKGKKINSGALETCKGDEVHRQPHFIPLLFRVFCGLAPSPPPSSSQERRNFKSNPHRKSFRSELCWSHQLRGLVPGAPTREYVTPSTINEKLMLCSYNCSIAHNMNPTGKGGLNSCLQQDWTQSSPTRDVGPLLTQCLLMDQFIYLCI